MAKNLMTKRRSSRNVTLDLNALCEEFNVTTSFDKNRRTSRQFDAGVNDRSYPKGKVFAKRMSTKMDLNALCKEFGVEVKEEMDKRTDVAENELVSPRPRGTSGQRMHYLEEDDPSVGIENLVADLLPDAEEEQKKIDDVNKTREELVFKGPTLVDNKLLDQSNTDSDSDHDSISVIDSILLETSDVMPMKTK